MNTTNESPSIYNKIKENIYDSSISQLHLYDNNQMDKPQPISDKPTVQTEIANKKQHHIILRTIWSIDRFNPSIPEKLKELKILLDRYNPNILCDIYHESSGEVIARASPLIIACFEGDPDVIKLLIECGADVNQTESEHYLSALHIICDAEFNGQSMTVWNKPRLGF